MDKKELLKILTAPGVGQHRARLLIGHFQNSETVLKASFKSLCQVDGIDEKTAHAIRNQIDHQFVDQQLIQIEKHNVQLVSFWDPQYPKLLKRIYDPPALLYVKGKLSKHQKLTIAVVGMRAASQYGRWMAEMIGAELSKRGIVVVSGMARGVDTHAHQGALQNGGETWAVFGCGLDIIYPPENKNLYHKIIDQGAVISEFPMGAEPLSTHFPRRNRIISGLSLGTVVVEAGHKSGALITAYNALSQSREVFAVPGDIRSKKSVGTHRLIKEGAKLIENVEDILDEIPQWKKLSQANSRVDQPLPQLSQQEKQLWDVLSKQPTHVDKLAKQAKMDVSETLSVLLSLELKDAVKQMAGMMFMRR